ncbi:MAG: glycosyltransferase family 2 protein [Desulfuromonadaceae bacterium]|nr:glycosyltransferase family 2 protein [Desulfuromonadaceae bacterium]MDD2848959.1 glycosyltransferase family 2 protein [Desulfuromonadaceae bacterium]MDD4130308.1 glycosyltransferase family 2 protein [Desulfuromonadaceae bacterium]
MLEAPLVSIIIPTYNNNPVVCQAIDCALNQTYKNLEIIVVDDGSTDGTESLLRKKYKGKIRYIRQKNRGTGGARNTGIRNAKGEYLQLLDADDLLAPDKIDIQMRQLRSTPEKALSYCDYSCCDIYGMAVPYERISPRLQDEKPFNDIMLKWETGLTIPVHCFVFDAGLFRDNNIAFDETLQANEDWECWMNVFALEPQVFFVDRVLAFYRVRDDSRCRNRVKMRKSYLAAIDKQIDINRQNGDVLKHLHSRREQIDYLYQDAAFLNRLRKKCPLMLRNVWSKVVPWRVKRKIEQLFA